MGGNSSHDHIVQQMGAGLHVELGDYTQPTSKVIDSFDYRFVICKRDILRDCARFVLQHANTSEVGKNKKEKKLFAEILEGIFADFFSMDIKEQSTEFLNNDVSQSDDDDDEYQSPPPLDTVNNGVPESPDPISKIMRKMNVQNEQQLTDANVCLDDEQIKRHLTRYFDAKESEQSILIYGNR